MARSDECYSTQLIDGDGIFNATGIENFIEEVRLRECGLSYAVVSIMGPQSSDVVIEEAKWDTSKVRDKLQRDIDAHITSVRTAKLAEITAHYEAKLKEALAGPVEALLDGASSDTWPAIRKLFRRETEAAVSGLSGAISGFDMDGQSKDKMLGSIENYARGVLKQKLEKKLEGS